MKIQDWRAALTRCLLLAAVAIPSSVVHAAPAAPLTVLQPAARVIVKLKPWSVLLAHPAQAAASQAHPMAALGGRMGLALGEGRRLGERTQVVTATGLSSAALARRLASQSDVEYAVVDHWMRAAAMPNDPDFSTVGDPPGPVAGQWYLQAPDATLVSAVNATAAWDITKGASDQVVAVLDTGIRSEHPDLVGKVAVGYDMITDPTIANDGSGRDNDPGDPGDWNNATECTNPDGSKAPAMDSTWHGTQVAGVIGAATDNGVGMAGLGWNVKVLPVRVLGKCGGYESDIEAAMLWAAGLTVPGLPTNPYPARILNLSLGGDAPCSTSAYPDVLKQVIDAGAVVVVAAGNPKTGTAVELPANCSTLVEPGVVAVGGLRHAGDKVGYSAMGAEVTLSAPAGNCVNTAPGSPCEYPILTTSNSGTQGPVNSIYTGSYNPSLGTSFSAPMVSATVALMRSVNPDMTPAEVVQALKNSVRTFPTVSSTYTCPSTDPSTGECDCTTSTCGAGMLDAGAAVQAAQTAYWSSTAASLAPSGTAAIGVTPVTPYPYSISNRLVELDVTPSLLPSGTHVVSCQWTITDGGGIVTNFEDSGAPTSTICPDPASSASTDAKPQLKPTGPGDIQVTLTLTVNDGTQDIALPAVTRVIHVISPLSNPVSSTSSGGGGGGALDGWPLAGLALAIGVLAASGRQRKGAQG